MVESSEAQQAGPLPLKVGELGYGVKVSVPVRSSSLPEVERELPSIPSTSRSAEPAPPSPTIHSSRLQRCLGTAGLLPPLPQTHPSDPSLSAEATELWKRPSLIEVLRSNPRKPFVVTALGLVTGGLVAGWIITSQISARSDAARRASGDSSRVITINTLLLHVAFAIRCAIILPN